MAFAITAGRVPCAHATAVAAVKVVRKKGGAVPAVYGGAEVKPGPASDADAILAVRRVLPADVSAGAAIELVGAQVRARIPAHC